MENAFSFLQDNAEWLFGTGGLAALILGTLKLLSGKGGAQVSNSFVGGDVVGRNKTTSVYNQKTRGLVDVLLYISILFTAVGGLSLWVAKTSPAPPPPHQEVSPGSKSSVKPGGHK